MLRRSVLSVAVVVTLSSSAFARHEPPADAVLLDQLDDGVPAAEVAEAAGCADVASLDAYLLGPTGEFVRLTAGVQKLEMGAQQATTTPLAAERFGFRPSTSGLNFRLTNGDGMSAFGRSSFFRGRTDPFGGSVGFGSSPERELGRLRLLRSRVGR